MPEYLKMPKGNKYAKGTPGNKGGGRPPLPKQDRKDKHVRISQRLWVKIQAMSAGKDWREFLETLLNVSHGKNESE